MNSFMLKKKLFFLIFLTLKTFIIFFPLEASVQKYLGNVSPQSNIVITNPGYNPGMFSTFSSILGALHFYDLGMYSGLKVNLTWGLYFDTNVGPNWWNYYFEPIDFVKPNGPEVVIENRYLNKLARFGIFDLGRKRAYQLIKKYVQIKFHIQEKIDLFAKNNFQGSYIIGCHYRGTDKCGQGGGLPFNQVFDTIQTTIDSMPKKYKNNYKIFIATDDQPFLDAIKERFKCPILYYDVIRSTDGTPVHYNYYTSNYQKGEDALIDCLLLSKCNFLFKMDSNLSRCSAFFNPFIPTMLLTDKNE